MAIKRRTMFYNLLNARISELIEQNGCQLEERLRFVSLFNPENDLVITKKDCIGQMVIPGSTLALLIENKAYADLDKLIVEACAGFKKEDDLIFEFGVKYKGKSYMSYTVLSKAQQTWENVIRETTGIGVALRMTVKNNKMVVCPDDPD